MAVLGRSTGAYARCSKGSCWDTLAVYHYSEHDRFRVHSNTYSDRMQNKEVVSGGTYRAKAEWGRLPVISAPVSTDGVINQSLEIPRPKLHIDAVNGASRQNLG